MASGRGSEAVGFAIKAKPSSSLPGARPTRTAAAGPTPRGRSSSLPPPVPGSICGTPRTAASSASRSWSDRAADGAHAGMVYASASRVPHYRIAAPGPPAAQGSSLVSLAWLPTPSHRAATPSPGPSTLGRAWTRPPAGLACGSYRPWSLSNDRATTPLASRRRSRPARRAVTPGACSLAHARPLLSPSFFRRYAATRC